MTDAVGISTRPCVKHPVSIFSFIDVSAGMVRKHYINLVEAYYNTYYIILLIAVLIVLYIFDNHQYQQ